MTMADPAGPPFFEVVFAQRAHRDFSDAPLDDATLELLLRAGTHAPSAENKQPWEFVVVRDPEVRTAIHDLTEEIWVDTARAFSQDRVAPHILEEVEHGFAGGGFRSAPVVLVVCADVDRGMRATAASSIFPCVQNILLAAGALGLGSALTTLGAQGGERLTDLLALPAHVVPLAIVPLGHPARPLGPPRREPATEHAHRDRFGARW